jgi:hypothetical protein
VSVNPFYPAMTHFTLPLHARREELIALAQGWADEHGVHVSLERFFPHYSPASVALGGDLAAAIASSEPVRRVCLRRGGEFDIAATNEIEHLSRNPGSFVFVLEPLTEDGLRATAITGRMADERELRWWVGLARDAAAGMGRGAWAIEPGTGAREFIPDHLHTAGAQELAASGVPMLGATGGALFEFDDLTA